MSSATILGTTALLECLPSNLESKQPPIAIRGPLDLIAAYVLLGRGENVIGEAWAALDFETRESLRTAAKRSDAFLEMHDGATLGGHLGIAMRNPWRAVVRTVLLPRIRRISKAVNMLAEDEDNRANRVIERFGAAAPQPNEGEFITLSSEQIRTRSW